jgi:hypothetical protein
LKGGDEYDTIQKHQKEVGFLSTQIHSEKEGTIMTKISKIMALTALTTLAIGMTAIGNAVADEARNETIIEGNLAEIWHKGNFAVMDEIVATNYVRHLPGGQDVRGREGYKQHVLGFMTPFPDLRFTMNVMI